MAGLERGKRMWWWRTALEGFRRSRGGNSPICRPARKLFFLLTASPTLWTLFLRHFFACMTSEVCRIAHRLLTVPGRGWESSTPDPKGTRRRIGKVLKRRREMQMEASTELDNPLYPESQLSNGLCFTKVTIEK